MKRMQILWGVFIWISMTNLLGPAFVGAEFKTIIMQDKKREAAKFRPLLEYLKARGVDISFVAARNYPHAAKLFSEGNADGMFSGSGIAGCMIIKNVAHPAVRPVHQEGWSTYRAVVIGTSGMNKFTQSDWSFFQRRFYCLSVS